MKRLIPIRSKKDIPQEHKDTPIGRLFEYHNFERPREVYSEAQLLVGMCMDNRKHLHIPDNFSYIIRTGGANMRYSEFKLSYAIGVGGVRHVALIGHDGCGMVDLVSRKEQCIQGLIEGAGWERKAAEEHFDHFAPIFEIGDELDFVLNEAERLRSRYPKITIVPLMYLVDDGLLYMIKE
ncbi:MAG: carbonic anhydrase [Candidatus Omnitrophota bacterium]